MKKSNQISKRNGPAFFISFFISAAVACVVLCIANAYAQVGPQDPPPLAIEVIRNKDGSITVPAEQIEKMSDYFNHISQQNLELRRAINAAGQKIQQLERRRCS